MTFDKILGSAAILLGAVVLLKAIVNARALKKYMPFIPFKSKARIEKVIIYHYNLMYLFLFGYLAIVAAFIIDLDFITMPVVGMIFFTGAVFVYLGVHAHNIMLVEIQTSISGIVPICAECKKICEKTGSPDDQESWRSFEDYVADKSDIEFTHSYCPNCYTRVIRELNKYDKK